MPDSTAHDSTAHDSTAHDGAAPDTAARPHPGGTAPLGDRTVARIGYGAMQLERHHDDPAAGIAVLRRAVELGVDHVDTAAFYGNGFVNGLIRDALTPADGVTVVSKVGAVPNPGGPIPLRPAQRPAELREQVETNLRELGLDAIPVVNLRRLDVGPGITAEGDQVVDLDDQLAEMTAMRDEGLIGGIGLSAISPDVLRRALPAGIVGVQNAYSLLDRQFEDMLHLCTTEGIAWVPFFPLGSAFPGLPKVTDEPAVVAAADALGRTPSQIGLAWLLGHAPEVLLIPGTGSIAHLEENLAAGEVSLDADTTATLDGVAAARGAAPTWPAPDGTV